jgi:small nuclear ribonucleoprotein (snRNP)-like protein
MLKKVLSLALIGLLISVTASAVYARSQDDKRTREIEKIKEDVRKLGVGQEARVEVTLHDGRKFKGTIREATDDTFLVLEEKTKTTITVPYSDVAKLKGKNGLTAAKVGINVAKGVGIVAGVAAAFTLLMYIVIPKS